MRLLVVAAADQSQQNCQYRIVNKVKAHPFEIHILIFAMDRPGAVLLQISLY